MGIRQFVTDCLTYEGRRKHKFKREHPPVDLTSASEATNSAKTTQKIEIDLQKRLEDREEETRKKVQERVKQFLANKTGHIARETTIDDLHDIAMIVYDIVHHDFARISAAYIEEVENKLKNDYVSKRAKIGKPSPNIRRLIAQYQQKVLVYKNLSRYLIRDFDDVMIRDDLEFTAHAITKLRENTSSEKNPVLPPVLNEGGRYGDL